MWDAILRSLIRTSLEMCCFLQKSCGSQSDTPVACFQLTVHCLGYGSCSDWYHKGMGTSYASCDDCISQGSPERAEKLSREIEPIGNTHMLNIFLYSIKIKKYWFIYISRDVFIYLFLKFIEFLAALGLCCCARAFSSGREWGLLIAVVPLVWEHAL